MTVRTRRRMTSGGRRRSTASRAVAVAVALVVAGCSSGDDSGTGASSTADESTAGPSAPPAEPSASPAPSTSAVPETTGGGAAAGFERVVPGGDCQCADGSEYQFYVRKADPSKVVLFFQGGGACFSAETCTEEDGATSKLTVGPGDDPSDDAGIFDFSDPRNPFADHSVVYAPYCSGDVYLGDKTNEYSPAVTVQHKGFVNGSAALDHLVSTFPGVEQLVVTGESAGSIPTPLFAGLASDELSDADITVLADGSGAYGDVPSVNTGIGALWGTENAVPDWPETRDLTPEQWSLPGLFVYAGAHDPDIMFARHDYAYDGVQRQFSDMTGIAGPDLLRSIDENETMIEQAGVDLASYIAPGDSHTTLSQPNFYAEAVNGVKLVDWVTALVDGEPVDDVHCEQCDRPPPVTTG